MKKLTKIGLYWGKGDFYPTIYIVGSLYQGGKSVLSLHDTFEVELPKGKIPRHSALWLDNWTERLREIKSAGFYSHELISDK